MYPIFMVIIIIWADRARNNFLKHIMHTYTEMLLFINEDNNLIDSQILYIWKRRLKDFLIKSTGKKDT